MLIFKLCSKRNTWIQCPWYTLFTYLQLKQIIHLFTNRETNLFYGSHYQIPLTWLNWIEKILKYYFSALYFELNVHFFI